MHRFRSYTLDEPMLHKFDSVPSWSVECGEFTYDDARQIDGVWYYRHEATREIRRFEYQQHVVPLFKN